MEQALSLVAQWNEIMLEAVRNDGASPTPTTYHMHLTTAAVYDAWAAYDTDAYGYYTDIIRPASEHTEGNKEVAVSYAFYEMLIEMFPEQSTLFEDFMDSLGYDVTAVASGADDPIAVARAAVEGVLEARANDGSNFANDFADTTGYVPVNDPQEGTDAAPGGDDFAANSWQPLRVPTGTLRDENGTPIYDDNDPDSFVDQVALTPHWGSVDGFGLDSVGQILPPPPPQLGDDSPYTDGLGNLTTNDQAYRDQFSAVAQASADLTTEQKVIAEYWADGPRTEAPPGHWNQIAQDISSREGHGIDDDAKMFFALNTSLLDAGIATWGTKFTYDFVRPQSAIRNLFFDEEIQSWGGPDQGTQTILGQDWQPYQQTTFVTPPFPEYTSGHSSFSMAAAHTISAYVGTDAFYDGTTQSIYDLDSIAGTDLLGQYVATDLAFETFTGDPVVLQWDTLFDAAEDAGISRIYGGIHIQDGDLNGRVIGTQVAELGEARWNALFTRAGDDDLTGTEAGDMIIAGTGDDTVSGGAGDDTISGGAGQDNLTGGADADVFQDVVQDFFGDIITDFEAGSDSILFQDIEIERSALSVRENGSVLGIDADNSGAVDADEELTLQGGLSGGEFMAVATDGNTHVTFESFLPQLQDATAIDAAAVNGVINTTFFEGDGARDFAVTLNDTAAAGFDSALGVYEVDAAGDMVNVQLVFANSAAQDTKVIQDVSDGHQLGFFLVQDGADWAATLSDTDTLSFAAADAGAGNISDTAAPVLMLNGVATNEVVFHSLAAALNSDGLQHVLSGVDAGGTSITVGFEDLLGGGDLDYQDYIFSVASADSFIM